MTVAFYVTSVTLRLSYEVTLTTHPDGSWIALIFHLDSVIPKIVTGDATTPATELLQALQSGARA
jgi:hypothetical protein